MAPRTFATLATHMTYGRAGEGVLVGRMVANTAFIEALARYSNFERFRLYVGESADEANARHLFGEALGDRLEIRNLLELGRDLAAAELDVLHFGSHLDRIADLFWLRDRYATRNIPITGQIHSLSYPRSMSDYLRFLLAPPSENDAVLCSTESGKLVVENSIGAMRDSLKSRGVELAPLKWELPVIPLGVDVEQLAGGDGPALRHELDIPKEAFCALALARFSEYDKMDIFPLLLAFRGVVQELERPSILLLAGARQGTKTPEMIQIWARALGIEANLRFLVDFPEAQKPAVLAAADVFVSPTDNVQETFGITVIEAMAAGLAPIVADFDGYRESVTEEVGIRIPTSWSTPSDELRDLGPLLYERPLHLLLGQSVVVELKPLEAALLRLGRDSEQCAAYGAKARERAQKVYDWAQVIPRYEALVERLAAKPFDAQRRTRAGEVNPLALDYGEVFSHYPTQLSAPDRKLRTSNHGRALRSAGATPPIYPELGNLFNSTMVAAALIGADAPIAADHLAGALSENFPSHPIWQAEQLLAWMEKQGLLDAALD